jgi:hypothetical protein
MTIKVNGAAYSGIWVEKQVTFATITFATNIAASNDYSVFGVVESCLVQALKYIEMSATVLGVSPYNTTTNSVQVMLGYAEGMFSDVNGVIATAIPVTGAAVDNTQTPPAPVSPITTTFNVTFAYWDGSMPTATLSNGALAIGPGATSGATPTNSPTGTDGYYPVEFDVA